jgi:hypothetical protein
MRPKRLASRKTAMADTKICKMMLKRIGVPGYEVVEYQHLSRVPQLGSIIETAVNKKAIRAHVSHVHGPEPGEAGDYSIYLDEAE